jgi:hypothetical protein
MKLGMYEKTGLTPGGEIAHLYRLLKATMVSYNIKVIDFLAEELDECDAKYVLEFMPSISGEWHAEVRAASE